MIHEIIELKPGWFIKRPRWMSLHQWRFDPITIALIVGGSLTAAGQIQQGRAAKAAGETQEAIAQRNALLAERQAEAEQQAAAREALQQERQGRALKGSQRAAIAKAGVQARGTPLSLIVETAENLEADRLNILREGAITASQLKGQAGVFRAQGAAAAARGKAASRASRLAATGTILTTIGTASLAQSQFGTPKTGRPNLGGGRIGGSKFPSRLSLR